MAKKKVTKVCSCCGSDLEIKEFYVSYSPIYQSDGRLPVCKNCLEQIYLDNLQHYLNEEQALYKTCLSLDIIYDDRLVLKVKVDNANKTDTNLIVLYMAKVNTFNKNKTARDSSYMNIWNTQPIDEPDYKVEKLEDYKANVITAEMVKRWGVGKTPSEYMFLEERYNTMRQVYDSSPNSLWLYERIAKYYLDIRREEDKENPDYKKINAINEQVLKLNNACKMNTSQNSDEDEKMYFSKFIEEIELTEPIPEASKEFQDANNIKKYIRNEFLKPLARAKGLEKDNGEDE